MSTAIDSGPTHPGPLSSLERRVLGVLVEKAKTTPDAYPLSLNALRTGCNQKNNRYPQMELDDDQVERAADSLRQKGALTLVQGDSRVERYRHRMYEWLGVEKAELAVVAELLLRGAQTVGDLRGRAARMEPIPGLSELTPIVDALVAKGFVEYLSPPGRGAVVTHTFYSENERDKVCREFGVGGATPVASRQAVAAPAASADGSQGGPADTRPATGGDWELELLTLREELTTQISELRNEVERLRQRVEG
ncbi:DUF480 domain-containing protein [Botrimarina mediterranea]|uniref:Uncharacterized protein n=1 Tax=Botrimarina mediterranea TaxID=2528022 RepID=A0A518KDP6_9BACT|nr:DUF480 domain-containing protein [Botrimarina mediterranea]QDV75922.1 hypothetical protein Spa11_41450 [Botrimarina mediterranea]QDV80517.1 hypothetical protein K2D_41460 [Planctomycetes bacterium K2D]